MRQQIILEKMQKSNKNIRNQMIVAHELELKNYDKYSTSALDISSTTEEVVKKMQKGMCFCFGKIVIISGSSTNERLCN